MEVPPSLISAVTDAVLEDLKSWQARPLKAVYPIVSLDAIHVKMRTGGHVQGQVVYLALALTQPGEKELPGLWFGEAEGAKFWLGVLTELRNRGVQDVLITSIDGLARFPGPIETVPEGLRSSSASSRGARLAQVRIVQGVQGRGPRL